MKIVLDTNVLIDAFKDDYSYEKRIIDEVIAGKIQAYANHQTLQENKLILNKLVDSPDYERELNDFFAQLNTVRNRHQIHIVRDPEDNKILESAVEAEADYLITRDNDLLRLGRYHNIQIVDPTSFWIRYTDNNKDNVWSQWTNFIFPK
jgi:putative PIN family toxin of toxin-antitoxin system